MKKTSICQYLDARSQLDGPVRQPRQRGNNFNSNAEKKKNLKKQVYIKESNRLKKNSSNSSFMTTQLLFKYLVIF